MATLEFIFFPPKTIIFFFNRNKAEGGTEPTYLKLTTEAAQLGT